MCIKRFLTEVFSRRRRLNSKVLTSKYNISCYPAFIKFCVFTNLQLDCNVRTITFKCVYQKLIRMNTLALNRTLQNKYSIL